MTQATATICKWVRHHWITWLECWIRLQAPGIMGVTTAVAVTVAMGHVMPVRMAQWHYRRLLQLHPTFALVF